MRGRSRRMARPEGDESMWSRRRRTRDKGVVVSEQRAMRSPREGFRKERRVELRPRKVRSKGERGIWSG